MMIIGKIPVEDAVVAEKFSCDLAKCKGACCTLEGGRGAPLLDEEKSLVERAIPVVLKHLPARSQNEIASRGAVDGVRGSYATTCIDDRDCVFVVYDGDVAKCSIEAAFNRGEYPWRKPVSCHLFPLRYAPNGAGLLRYESIAECAPGRAKGKTDGTPLHLFVKEALVRRFGAEWYERFGERASGGGARVAAGERG
jgi:hypothetical protein